MIDGGGAGPWDRPRPAPEHSVTRRALVSKAVRPFLLLAPFLLGVALLPGCESDSYSEALNYHIRTDPIVKEVFPGERPEPDRPGQLPLLAMSQLNSIAPLVEGGTSQGLITKVIDPTKISDQDKEKLQATLDEIFGTPAHPRLRLKGTEGLQKLLRTKTENLEDTLAHGSRVYRVQCMQCHGVTGDGRGPTAPWVNPHPRDYRPGLFKFQSRDQVEDKGYGKDRKPSRDDLLRTLRNGLEGTAMPAFNLLPDEDLEALVSYVILLSLRGEGELYVFKFALEEKGGQLVAKPRTSIAGTVKAAVAKAADVWVKSQADSIMPVPYPKYSDEEMKTSVLRGQAMFVADEAELKKLFPKATAEQLGNLKGVDCQKCHKDYGRQALFKFDDWGTMVRPANLTVGVYRGGRRPVDLYYRIHSGINGSGMNSFPFLTGDQIWDLVNFVRAVPYPAMLRGYKITLD
jgi:mono/diheme cytochrome c family protein